MKYLIKNDIDINAVDNNGDTFLHYVIRKDRPWAQINKKNSDEAYENILKGIKYFLKKGADINIRNNKGFIFFILF